MERRFALFLALTLLIWTGFIALQMVFAPAPQPVAEQADDPAAENADQPDGPEGGAADASDDPAPPPEDSDPAVQPAALAERQVPQARGTLGSVDPASPYKLLVHWNSRGAAIERVELVGYWAVDYYSGHLGHLALADAASGGALVHVVGPGTAAALAVSSDPNVKPGLQPTDVIKSIDDEAVESALDLSKYLNEQTRPDQEVKLVVERKGVPRPVTFTARLTRRPLEVVKPESHTYPTDDGGLRAFPDDPLSLLLTLDSIGGRSLKPAQTEFASLPSLYQSNWKVEQQGDDFIEFSYLLDEAALAAIGKAGPLKIRKRYTLARVGPDGEAFHIDLKVTIDNLGTEPQAVGYRLNGPTGLPLEGWWYSTKLHHEMWAGAGARDVAYRQAGLQHTLVGCPKIYSEAKSFIEAGEPPLIPLLMGDVPAPFVYAGVDTQFFASAILPQATSGNQDILFRSAYAMPVQDVTAIPKNLQKTTNVTVRLATNAKPIEPGESLVHDYRVFFGPKDGDVLTSYGLSELMEYGWWIFEYPAKILQGILTFLHDRVVFNYGLAIILLTMLVRSCMVPISLKQARSAAKMQELAPEMAKIKQKHPDDPMKQHQAMQELYKKHNFNPFGGCLLVFFQLPIFIGLYRCLSVDIDLRDASLIPGIPWAANLAGPDKLFYWEDWMISFLAAETGWLGPFFNILPIVTVGLFLLQQKMFMPPPTDEQTRLQQQMMTYMMVFMGVMFYKVPAGLCVYFITSSLWGIAERKMLGKSKPKESGDGGGGVPAVPEKKPASPNGHAKPTASKKKKQRQR